MKLILPLSFLFCILFSSNQIPAPNQDHPIIIQGATIHTVSDGILDELVVALNVGRKKYGWSEKKLEEMVVI